MIKTKHKVKVSNNIGMEVHERACVPDLWERVTKKEHLQENLTDNMFNIINI